MLVESKYLVFVGRIDGRGWKLWWCFQSHVVEIVSEAIGEFFYDFLEYMEKMKFAIVGKQNWITWSDFAACTNSA